MLRLSKKKIIVVAERRRMSRKYLVHLYNLIDEISITALIIQRFYRLRNLTFLEISDRRIVLRFQLIDFKI